LFFLSNRLVLITGVAGGIGAATSQVFKASGWQVVGVDNRSVEGDFEGDYFFLADISNPSSVSQVFSQVAELSGRFEALVNNAAIQLCKPLISTTSEEWDSIMAANVRSAYLMARGAYSLMKAGGGAVVNVSSVHALATSRNIAAYAASKGALLALTRALALELAPEIRVNAVAPGAIETQMLISGLTRGHLAGTDIDKLLEQLERRHPLGRIGKPKEVAEAVLFLCDNKRSSFITGQLLVVDGGALARLSTE
jgi:NAD(P)-dependent dehydrogenase (short-subunit alcohol dehydrogenase family)